MYFIRKIQFISSDRTLMSSTKIPGPHAFYPLEESLAALTSG